MKYKDTMEKFNDVKVNFPNFVTTLEKIYDHPGSTENILEQYGLGRKELRRLEKLGHAVRARTKNVWTNGEKLPNGREVELGSSYRGHGFQLRWILVA